MRAIKLIPVRYVVIVTASRDWTDEAAVYERLMYYPDGTIVFHGACRGGDKIAHEVATGLNLWPVPHPYFNSCGRAGGPLRNELMVRLGCVYKEFGYTVVVEGFPLPGGSGTQGCMDMADAAGLTVKGWMVG